VEALLPHFVEYDIEGHPSIAALAQSLLSNERLAKEAVLLLEAYIPGLVIETSAVSVRRITQDSPLKQAFVVAIVAAFQPKLEHDVPVIITDLTGHILPPQYHTLVTVLVMMIAVYGISKAIDLLFPGRKTSALDENYRALTVVAGDLIQIPPATVDAAVRARYSGKKPSQLSAFVKGFFAPTTGQPGAKIVGGPGIEISRDALAQIPQLELSEVDEEAEKTDSEFANNKLIIVHAMDRDRGKVGWAGHIPDLFQDRVPMKLDKSINPESLFSKTRIIGDVLIVYAVSESGERNPTEIHLLRLRDGERSKRRKATG
jgi:hypothetical protein